MKVNRDNSALLNTYDNQGAHDQIRKMMLRQKWIVVTFKLDEFNAFAAVVESRQDSKFNYQIDSPAVGFLIDYIFEGKINDNNVNPSDIIYGDEGQNDNDVQINILELMLAYGYIPHMSAKFMNPHIMTATFKGQRGSIILDIQRDEKLEKLMAEYDIAD